MKEHDGAHKKRLGSHEKMRLAVSIYMAHFTAPLLRLMIGCTAEFLLIIHLKRCVNNDLIAVIYDAKASMRSKMRFILKIKS